MTPSSARQCDANGREIESSISGQFVSLSTFSATFSTSEVKRRAEQTGDERRERAREKDREEGGSEKDNESGKGGRKGGKIEKGRGEAGGGRRERGKPELTSCLGDAPAIASRAALWSERGAATRSVARNASAASRRAGRPASSAFLPLV